MKLDIYPYVPAGSLNPRPDIVLGCRFIHDLVFYYAFLEDQDKGCEEAIKKCLNEMRCYKCGAFMARALDNDGLESSTWMTHWGETLFRDKVGAWRVKRL